MFFCKGGGGGARTFGARGQTCQSDSLSSRGRWQSPGRTSHVGL